MSDEYGTEYVTREEFEEQVRLNEALQRRLSHFEERLEALEEGGSAPNTGDRYGDLILDNLDPGQTVKLSHIKRILIEHTSIQTDKTASKRAKDVIQRYDAFEPTPAHATWVYDP